MKNKVLNKYLDSNNKNWLITGGAGFIGSNIIERLLLKKQAVVCLDNLSTGNKNNIKDVIESVALKLNVRTSLVKKNFQFIKGDIRSVKNCQKAFKNKVDFVLHQAALGSVPRSFIDPLSTHDVNVNGFLNIYRSAALNKVSRFVFASSSSVYGDIKDSPKREDRLGNVSSPYALSKLINEMYIFQYYKIYKLNYVGLRYFNIFGKRQNPRGAYAAVIPKWIDAMKNNKKIQIYGDGKTTRDFCYISNAVEANLLSAICSNNSLNQIYNIGTGKKTSLNELFKLIKLILSENLDREYFKNPYFNDFRKGDIRQSLADISKAKKLLNYNPAYDLLEGLKKTIV